MKRDVVFLLVGLAGGVATSLIFWAATVHFFTARVGFADGVSERMGMRFWNSRVKIRNRSWLRAVLDVEVGVEVAVQDLVESGNTYFINVPVNHHRRISLDRRGVLIIALRLHAIDFDLHTPIPPEVAKALQSRSPDGLKQLLNLGSGGRIHVHVLATDAWTASRHHSQVDYGVQDLYANGGFKGSKTTGSRFAT